MLDKREAESVMSSVMVWKKRLVEDELVEWIRAWK